MGVLEVARSRSSKKLTASASGLMPLSISDVHIEISRRSRWQFCGVFLRVRRVDSPTGS